MSKEPTQGAKIVKGVLTSMKLFLESTPPGKEVGISDPVETRHSSGFGPPVPAYYIDLPTIEIHCSTKACNGIRCFGPSTDKLWLRDKFEFFSYKCKNCGNGQKIYAVGVVFHEHSCKVLKLGEVPAFGPPKPSRLTSLIGPDKENFLKGRRSENQGLGMGAFTYYLGAFLQISVLNHPLVGFSCYSSVITVSEVYRLVCQPFGL